MQNELVLNKGRELYVFRYSPGEEKEIIEVIEDLAKSQTTSFDIFDAAVLCCSITPDLFSQADQLLEDFL